MKGRFAFWPERVAKSAFTIPYEQLYEEGIRGIVFDIDNTLTLPDAPADEACRELFRRLGDIGLKACIVSNNRGPRVKSFAADVGADFVPKALKPRRYGYRRAMELMGTVPENTVSVGDQLFTDIWGANRIGMHSILTKPLVFLDEPQIMLKRLVEAPFLYLYRRKRRQSEKQ